jgi:hypothetical protein
MAKTFDPRCHELAQLFLSDEPTSTPADVNRLTAYIQQSIEDWIGYEKSPCYFCGKPRLGNNHDSCVLF